jgi:hypothetical protein
VNKEEVERRLMPFDKLRTGLETLLTELLSTNGFSTPATSVRLS